MANNEEKPCSTCLKNISQWHFQNPCFWVANPSLILNIFQEKHIQQLKKGIRDKENPLKVAQSRLEARTHRPDVELCRDPPHHRIVEEVGQIQESVDLLNRYERKVYY